MRISGRLARAPPIEPTPPQSKPTTSTQSAESIALPVAHNASPSSELQQGHGRRERGVPGLLEVEAGERADRGLEARREHRRIGHHPGHDEGQVAEPGHLGRPRRRGRSRRRTGTGSDWRRWCVSDAQMTLRHTRYWRRRHGEGVAARSRWPAASVLSQLAAGQAQEHVLEIGLAMPVDDVLGQVLGEGCAASRRSRGSRRRCPRAPTGHRASPTAAAFAPRTRGP